MRILLAAVICSSFCGKSETTAPVESASCKPEPPPTGEAARERDREQFLQRAAAAGVKVTSLSVKAIEETAPLQIAGSAAQQRCLSAWLTWFGLPRALALAAVDASPKAMSHVDAERFASEAAVAFYRAQQGGEERLRQLESVLREAEPRAKLALDLRELDARLHQLRPDELAAFRIRTALEALQGRLQKPQLEEQLRALR